MGIDIEGGRNGWRDLSQRAALPLSNPCGLQTASVPKDLYLIILTSVYRNKPAAALLFSYFPSLLPPSFITRSLRRFPNSHIHSQRKMTHIHYSIHSPLNVFRSSFSMLATHLLTLSLTLSLSDSLLYPISVSLSLTYPLTFSHFNEIMLNQYGIEIELTSVPSGFLLSNSL